MSEVKEKTVSEKGTIGLDKIYETLSKVDVSDHVEVVEGAKYLSWSWAYDYIMKFDSNFKYGYKKFTAEGIPDDFGDEEIGKRAYLDYQKLPDGMGYQIVCWAEVKGFKKEITLPVMGYKSAPIYPGETNKDGTPKLNSTVLNKNKQRALVKALAMFGLGLNLWMGEDLPQGDRTIKFNAETGEAVMPTLEEALEHIFTKSGKNYAGKTIKDLVNNSEKNMEINLRNVIQYGTPDAVYCKVVMDAIEKGELKPAWPTNPKA